VSICTKSPITPNWAVIFADEAQRYNKNEYEWLRDVHDSLGQHDIRLFVFLVGQPQLLGQKIRLRDDGEQQIVLRFMVEELQFCGILSAEDAATTMNGYDETVFPDSSGWSYTRFCYPLAFNAGYRLVQDAHRLWQAFAQAHDEEKFVQRMEIPMDNFSRAMEYLLLEAPVKDAAPFAFPPEVMRQAVVESLYIEAQRAYSSPTPKT